MSKKVKTNHGGERFSEIEVWQTPENVEEDTVRVRLTYSEEGENVRDVVCMDVPKFAFDLLAKDGVNFRIETDNL